MNLLDMHTREKLNKIHIEEMHREANARRLLRQAKQARKVEKILRTRKLALALFVLVIVFGPILLEINF